MRKLAFFLFGLGLLLGFIYPRIIGTKTGETLVEAPVYDGKSDQWRPLDIDLTPAENPVRLRVLVDTFPDKNASVRFFDLVAKITDPAGESAEFPFTIRRDDAAGHDPTSDVSRSFALLPDLTIDNPGAHVIELRQKRDLPLNMKSVSVEVIGSGAAVNQSLAGWGVPLMLAGGFLFFIDLRRRRRNRRAPPEPVELPGQRRKELDGKQDAKASRNEEEGKEMHESRYEDKNAFDGEKSGSANPKVGDIWTREARPERVRKKSGGQAGSIWDRAPEGEEAGTPADEDASKIKRKSGYKWGRGTE